MQRVALHRTGKSVEVVGSSRVRQHPIPRQQTRKELAGGAKTYRVEFAFFVVDVDERRDIVNDDVVLARGPLAVQKRCAAA